MHPDEWPTPWLTHLTLENPWPMLVTLGAIGAGLIVIGRRREQKRKIVAGIVFAVLGVLIWLAGLLISTDREMMVNRTRLLVKAAVMPVAMEVFGELLSRDVRLFDHDYESILRMIGRAEDRWGVKSAWITNLQVRQDGPQRGVTYLSVITRVDSRYGGGATQTRWLLHWRKETDGLWRLVKIEWIELGDRPAQEGDLP